MTSDILSSSARIMGGALAWLFRCGAVAMLAAVLPLAMGAPTITTTKTTDSNARKSQGDSITYTVTIANSGDAASGVVLTDPTPANTTLVNASVRVTPIAFDDTYGVLGNTQRIVSAASGVLANDIDPDDAGAFSGGRLSVKTDSVARVSANSTVTGSLSLSEDGSFVYTPPVGAASGTERFSYIVIDDHNLECASVGYIDFTISGRVWYVRNGGTGDGRSHSPLGDPAAASASATLTTDIIYVLANAGALNGPFTLELGQQLIGQAIALTANLDTNGSTAPVTFFTASATPTLTNTSGAIVTLSGATPSNTISGVTLGNRTTAAISGSNFGTLTVTSDVIINGTGSALSLSNGTLNATFASLSASNAIFGVSLTNVNGSLTANGGALATLSGDDVAISGGTLVFTYAGTITSSGGRSIYVANKTASGNVTFSGAITDTGTGIVLDNNDGAIVSFTGGLSLNTGSSAAFTATNGGTVIATQNNSTILNTITTTSGVALNVSNTSIGASGLTFRSISSNGASNGIVLLNTGSSGGLTVAGTDGSDGDAIADAGTGGTIRNSTGHGISLTSTRNVRLDGMIITANLGHGVYGSNVSGFVLEGVSVTGNGNDASTDESGVYLAELTGSPTAIRNSTISNNHEFEVVVLNSAGTLANFQLTSNTISANGLAINGTGVSPHGNLVTFQGLGTALMTLTGTGGTYTGNIDDAGGKTITATGIMVDHSGSGLVAATITGATFTNNNNAITVSAANGGNLDFDVLNNTATGNRSHALNLFVGASSTGTVTGSFQNNIVGASGVAASGSDLGYGIRVQNEGSTSTSNPVTVLIAGNTLREFANFSAINVNHGIAAQAFTRPMNMTVTNNTVANVANGRGIVIQQNNSTAAGIVNASISGNSFSGVAGQAGDGTEIRLRQLSGGTLNLSQAGLAALASANNLLSTDISISGTITYGSGTPTLPLMLASDRADPVLELQSVPNVPFVHNEHSLTVEASAELAVAPLATAIEQAPTLTQHDLDAVVAVATARWEATGLTAAQSAYLRGLRFEIADLPAWYLGEASGALIRVDRDAGGRGWFIEGVTASAVGRLDLLTAVLHEMGHALGLDDLHSAADRDDVMYGWLSVGERRLPAAGAAHGAILPGRGVTHFLSAPITIGTLPAGKSVVVTFQVTIDAKANITSQASVSGSNFTTVSSNSVTTEVNQPPVISAVSKSGSEDNAMAFASADFSTSFGDPNTGDTLASVTVISLPTQGVLKLGDTNVLAGAAISSANIATLTYTPNADFHGSDAFSWNATDSSTEALMATSNAAVNITVSPVSEVPSITGATTAEDSQSTSGLVVTRNASDGAEITHFRITGITGGRLHKNDGTTEILNGDYLTFAEANAGLKFTPSQDLNTGAGDTFEFTLAGSADGAGTGLGSATTATITVTEVNDAPIATDDAPDAIEEDSGARTISFASLVGSDSAGATNENGQSLTVSAVANAVGGTVEISNDNVIFTPTLNFAGTASFVYTVRDNGTTNGEGDPRSDAGSVSFTINAVNDAPTITAPATLNGSPNQALTITGVAFADVDSGANSVVATFNAPSGTFAATSGGSVTVSGSGTASITLTGTIADLNAFIAAESLTYTSSTDASITVGIDDEGFSGSGGDKTASAAIAISLDQPPVAGFGTAIALEAARSEGVEVAHNAALNFGTGSFTVEAWVKRTGPANLWFTIAGKQNGSGGAGWYLRFDDNRLSFYAGSNGVTSTATITDTSWHHVVGVLDASAKTVTIYLDGAALTSNSFATASNANSTAPLGLGFKPNYGEYFDGSLDEVRIWNTARTLDEIREFMRSPISGAESGLVGYWSFAGTGASVANHTATAGLNGTLQNVGGSAERTAGAIGYTASVTEDSGANGLRLGGNDVEDNATTFAKITALPAHGRLFHADGTTEITSASAGSPVTVVDAGGAPRRVVYVPAANYVGADSFGYILSDGTSDSANTETVNITVTAVNDAPAFTSDSTFSVSENATTGAAVGNVEANDGDGGANDAGLTYSITGGTGESLFSINASTGAITVNTTGAAALNYESAQSYTLTVRADDGAASSNTADQSITVNITDAAPSVTASQAFSIAENSVAAAVVGTVALTGDPDSITWSIQSGNTGGAFAISSATGQITVASSTALNYESSTSFSVGVRATDGTTNSDQTVTVNVTNVNEAPSLTSGATASFSENATGTVYTAAGSDPDASTTLTFTLGGTDAADFNIDANTGAVTFAATPNYESPADADTNNVYNITVTASDGTLASTAHAVAITVSNVNEAPSTTSGATASFGENATGTVYLATGSDPDASTTLTFSLGGTDAADFNIDASTGAVTFAAVPNYESPSDADANNVYNITVTASDGALTSSAHALAITVTNVNETPSVTSAASVNAAENQSVAYTVAGTDPDASTTLTYAIAGGEDASLFTIDASTGVVSFVVAPDYELPDDANENNVYRITVTASDGTLTSGTQAVDITVTDAADAPVVASGSAVSVAENQTAAYTVAGTDQDSDSTLTYAISGGADAAKFTINDSTGVVTFVSAPNFEAPADAGADNIYNITVTTNDGALTSAAHAVAITVTNVNETPSVTSSAAANAAENQTTAYTVTGSDPDASTTLTFAISGGADASLFTIDATSGVVSFENAPNFESFADADTDGVYEIEVTATDGTLTSATFAVSITVTDAPETPAVTSAATANAAENQTAAYTVTGSDADAGTTFIYAISGGAGAALFAINASTGAVTFNSAPNFEAPGDAGANNVYNITVTVSDGALTSADHAVAITVTNVNETPTVTSDSAATFAENATGPVYTVTGADPDASTSLTFALGGTDAALFSINSNTGVVTFVAAPNFEAPADAGANNVYELTVAASDGALTSAGHAVTITVSNENDAPTDIALSANSLTQSQSANANVGTLTTTDEDTGETFAYALVSGMGSDDNGSFNISADKLRANEPATLAPRNYSVRVQATDSANATFEKIFSVVVTDDVSPTITSITGPAAGIYGIGQTLEFSVTFTEPVTVATTDGTPVLNLTIGGVSQTALYAEGSGTTTLVFRYVVQAGDSTEGGALTAVSLTLEGGSIKDANGNNASLAFTANEFGGVVIEARFHSADTDHNWRLSLLELTRVIELYNTRSGTERTGEYHSVAETEGGFTSGTGAIVGHHSADTNEDGRIDLSELTRVIELYNTRDGTTRTGEYHRNPATEDGFATGPESRR